MQDEDKYTVVELYDDHSVLEKNDKLFIGRGCVDCKSSGWVTVKPGKHGHPCFSCNGKGVIVRRWE